MLAQGGGKEKPRADFATGAGLPTANKACSRWPFPDLLGYPGLPRPFRGNLMIALRKLPARKAPPERG